MKITKTVKLSGGEYTIEADSPIELLRAEQILKTGRYPDDERAYGEKAGKPVVAADRR